MASERRLRIKTLVMVLAMVVCANAGDLMLKRGMSQIGAVQITASGLAQAFRLTVTNGKIWIGVTHVPGGHFSARIGIAATLGWRCVDLRGRDAGGTDETTDN